MTQSRTYSIEMFKKFNAGKICMHVDVQILYMFKMHNSLIHPLCLRNLCRIL